MRRLKRSTNAPLGTAFFLFVSLAIIPVSLKAAGVKLGVNPRLSAAIDIWAEVAEVFGPSYGAAGGSELAQLIIPDDNQQNVISDDTCPLRQYASAGEVEELRPISVTPEIAAVSLAPSAKATRTLCKLASRIRANSKSVESSFAPAEIRVDVDADSRNFRASEHWKVEAAMQREVRSRLDKMVNVHGFDRTSINSLPIPKSFRMLIRLKQSATSSTTGAECKARAVLDGSVKARLERAALNGTPPAPDNCDL